MAPRDVLVLAIPAVALVALFAVPGEPRWIRRPWFIKGPPRRGPLAVLFAAFLVIGIARTLL